ncbi:hypothetical protein GALMADRAFT_213040 [Galerina marginata CBS 339.88]|uniref:Uncharacterized protein n=1 Tax=Galerina marginata (strain CBS 339.88) TaxID=685588 RepID=A0A067SNK9_GALM3|nr:hypothetical protein GALMADRAFT_213040 [Galerina marginata CBS 339.88]
MGVPNPAPQIPESMDITVDSHHLRPLKVLAAATLTVEGTTAEQVDLRVDVLWVGGALSSSEVGRLWLNFVRTPLVARRLRSRGNSCRLVGGDWSNVSAQRSQSKSVMSWSANIWDQFADFFLRISGDLRKAMFWFTTTADIWRRDWGFLLPYQEKKWCQVNAFIGTKTEDHPGAIRARLPKWLQYLIAESLLV